MFSNLKNKFAIDDERWNKYISYFKQIKVPVKTVLLAEGKIANKAYWIEKGCIRVWFNHNGKDITFQFFFENSMVASIESFKKEFPSLVTLETIEPCILWVITKKDAEKLIAEITDIPLLRAKFTDAIFERTFDYMKHFFSFIKDTPLQRYQDLIKEKPQLIQRVPQHYIASYLGVTSVHLSRLKSKLVKIKTAAKI
ncbi:MAG: Crp/Fnr family transcriptional regulator [Janthinobacterium lividum]